MNTLPLPGLKGAEPIGFLAAVGLLQICARQPKLGQVALGWNLDAEPTAVLFTEGAGSVDELVASALVPWMAGRWRSRCFGVGSLPPQKRASRKEAVADLTRAATKMSKKEKKQAKAALWEQDVTVGREVFAAELVKVRQVASCVLSKRAEADTFAALGTDAHERLTTGVRVIQATGLRLVAGNQAFLKLLRELAFSLDTNASWSAKLDKEGKKRAAVSPADSFRCALASPWDFSEPHADRGFLSLGWDAESYYVGALRGAMTPNSTPPRAATWLASEALSLMPVVPSSRGKSRTRGFDETGTFRWPIWSTSWSLDVVRTALGAPALGRTPVDRLELQALEISRVYGSGVVTLTDYPCFRPAVLIS